MILFGNSLSIVALCPDCQKPMSIMRQQVYPSIASGNRGNFSCVTCFTEGCISKNFVTTIENISGMVVYTDALYVFDRDKDEWKPSFARLGGTGETK